jgi:hypothetical protein
MTQFLLPPGFRATDDDDNPLAGGYYRFYAGGTTTPKAVYADAALSVSLGTTVNLNSAGEPVTGSNVQTMIYLNTGTYRVRLYDSGNNIILDQDGIPGSEEEAEVSTTGIPIIPVDSKTGAYSVVVGDRGNLLNCDPTGGSFIVTLPSAVTVGDNFIVGFRHNGSANQVSIVSINSQVIRGPKNVTSYALVNPGDSAWFIADGSDWVVASRSQKAPALYRVLDSIAAPPASPVAGAMYRIDGTPTGAWSTLGFADEDIVEADGNGSWIRHTPESGWIIFDADVQEFLKFTDGQWGPLLVPPDPSNLKTLIVQDQKSSGTPGGTPTTDAWTTAVLNTSVVNTITDSSLSSNIITLPAGRYRARCSKTFYHTGISQIRFKTSDDDSIVVRGETVKIGHTTSNDYAAATGALCHCVGEFEISEPTDFILQYYVDEFSVSIGTSSMGAPASIASTAEVYATVIIEDLASLQGPQGEEGDDGPIGPVGPIGIMPSHSWTLDPSTTDADPGSGEIRFNNASPASATQLYIDNNNYGGVDVSAWIDTWDDSGISAGRGTLYLYDSANPTTIFRIYTVTGTVTDGTGYRKVSVTHITGAGSFASQVVVAFQPRGPSGSGDVSGPASSTTNAVPLFSDTTGKIVKNSTIIDATGDFAKERSGGAVSITARRTDTHGDAAVVGGFVGKGKSSTGTDRTYSEVRTTAVLDDNGAENGRIHLRTIRGGLEDDRFLIDNGLTSPSVTGGDKGANTINVAGLYQNGTQVWSTVAKTSDETIQSDTTLNADAALVFAMSANTKYSFKLFVIFDTGATGDFKFRHAGPSSPTLVRIRRHHIIGAGTAYAGIAIDTAYSSVDVAVAGSAGPGVVEMDGIVHNGANAGNFEFQWAQNASEAVDTTVRAGSYIQYRAL